MMGRPGGDYRNPSHLGGVTCLIYVYVDHVDAHYAIAKAAGAVVEQELADQPYGDRTYAVLDPEGHSWTFAQHVRDVPFGETH